MTMVYSVKKVLLLLLICVGLVPVWAAKFERAKAKQPHPTAFELMDKYAETQDKLKSFIIKSESSMEADNSFRIGIGKSGRLCEVRYDGNRAEGNRVRLCEHLWGQVGKKFVPKDEPIYRSWLWDGVNYMRYTGTSKEKAKDANHFGKVHPYMSGAGEIKNGKLTSRMYGTALLGFFSGSEERADIVLRQARSISVRDNTEKINAVECYVIEADTPGGQYKVWIDPNHGYNIAKAQVELSEGKNHLFYGKPFKKAGKKLSFSLQTVRFEKIDEIWVPVEANTQSHRIYNKGDFSKARTHTKLTEVILNPDHNMLGSFVPDDIPDGAKVTAFVDLNDGFFTAWDPEYRWAGDAEFVVDRKGRWVRYEPEKGMLPVIKALPELRELELEIDPHRTKNKRILLCFCDMRQRSSQQCVLELKERVESLAQKDVTVALLQCSAGSMERVNAWIRKNEIQFPVGRIEQIIKKVLRAWRVEKLPWLILADKEHIVTAEGFGIDELNEKIKEGGDAKD